MKRLLITSLILSSVVLTGCGMQNGTPIDAAKTFTQAQISGDSKIMNQIDHSGPLEFPAQYILNEAYKSGYNKCQISDFTFQQKSDSSVIVVGPKDKGINPVDLKFTKENGKYYFIGYGQVPSLKLDSAPYVNNMKIFINNTPITISGDSNVISPPPVNSSIEVRGSVLGISIDEKQAIDSNNDSAPINALITQAVAKHALDILYKFNLSWTKAANDKNPSEMDYFDPSCKLYKIFYNDMTSSNDKYVFHKISIDPESIVIDQNSITVNSNLIINSKSINWQFQLQQEPGKSEWWVTDIHTVETSVNDSSGKYTKEVS